MSIALGNFKNETEAKQRIANSKARLRYIIKENKLKIKSSTFKFYIVRENRDMFGNRNEYPIYVYVKTPGEKYNWIFIA